MEIQKQINKTIELVSKENLWFLMTAAYTPSNTQITVLYGIKSIVLLLKWKMCFPYEPSLYIPHCLWIQFLMVLNNLILISEAVGSMLRSFLRISKERKDSAPRM